MAIIEPTKNGKVTVQLKKPIKRDSASIKQLTLSEPTYAQLEDLSLTDLNEFSTLSVLIPRISSEEVFESDVRAMGMADLARLNTALGHFT